MRNFQHPAYFDVGMKVVIPWRTPEKPQQGLLCRVIKAAGDHAYVENEKFKVARWISKWDCYVLLPL